MNISITTGSPRPKTARLLAQFKIAEQSEDRLVLQTKRITSLLAAAFVGTFGGIIATVVVSFYPANQTDAGTFLLGGALALVLLCLAMMFLYFGLREQDRILVDTVANEVHFERRRDPVSVRFDQLAEVAVRTENRSRARERCIVHPVVLVTRDGADLQVDAASDIEEMIRLAAVLRRLTGLPLGSNRVA